MGFLLDFAGGAGQAVANWNEAEHQNDLVTQRQVQLAQLQNELEIKRQDTLDQLKRSRDAQAGEQIASLADAMNAKRIAGLIGSSIAVGGAGQDILPDNLSQGDLNAAIRNQPAATPGETSTPTLAEAQNLAQYPDAMAAYGIPQLTRSQDLGNKADAAERLGLIGQSTILRGQQKVESDDNRMQLASVIAQNKSDQAERELARKEAHDQDTAIAQAAKDDTRFQQVLAMIGNQNKGAGNDDLKQRMAVLAGERGNQISLKGEMAGLDNALVNINKITAGKPNPDYVTNRNAYKELASQLAASRSIATAISTDLAKQLGIPVDMLRPAKDNPAGLRADNTNTPPDSAFAGLSEGITRTFSNGQSWTIRNGKPARIN